MAIIQCPECGKDISDQASVCIHCGFPLDGIKPNRCNINGKIFDLTEAYNISLGKDPTLEYNPTEKAHFVQKIIDSIIRKTSICNLAATYLAYKIYNDGCVPSEFDAQSYVERDKQIKRDAMEARMPCCPRCGSTSFTTGARGFSVWTGFIGSGKTVNRCSRCGHVWEPRR